MSIPGEYQFGSRMPTPARGSRREALPQQVQLYLRARVPICIEAQQRIGCRSVAAGGGGWLLGRARAASRSPDHGHCICKRGAPRTSRRCGRRSAARARTLVPHCSIVERTCASVYDERKQEHESCQHLQTVNATSLRLRRAPLSGTISGTPSGTLASCDNGWFVAPSSR